METGSRRRIVEYLKRHGEGSVSELSHVLGLTPVTIRHHLSALRQMEIIDHPFPRRKPGPGRPEMMYRLARAAIDHLPRNYDELCRGLIQELEDSLAPEALERLLISAAQRLLVAQGVEDGATPGQRLEIALAFCEARGYLPSIHESSDGKLLKLSNCPYLEIAASQPRFCTFDTSLLARLLGMDVSLKRRIVDGDESCVLLCIPD